MHNAAHITHIRCYREVMSNNNKTKTSCFAIGLFIQTRKDAIHHLPQKHWKEKLQLFLHVPMQALAQYGKTNHPTHQSSLVIGPYAISQ